jgi:hypothetical protein
MINVLKALIDDSMQKQAIYKQRGRNCKMNQKGIFTIRKNTVTEIKGF